MPTHYRGSAQERAALDAYIKLMRAADSVTARLDPLMRAADLTVGQFGALEALLHRGPLCQREVKPSAAEASRWWSAPQAAWPGAPPPGSTR
jgi:MarR family 2-MHQ and catechol resistance regulon transcriptional repressor